MLILVGCAPQGDNSTQVQSNQFALRGMVANDQQQIDALQEKLSRLNDRVAELEHSSSQGPPGNGKLASLEQRVSKLESAASAAPQATPGSAPSPQASASPAGPNEPEASGGGTDDTAEASTGGDTSATPAVPESTPAPAIPAENSPSWRAMMDQELASSPSDPGAKLYHAGLVNLKAGKYAVAMGQFEALQRRYPKSSLSEPAEFFAANALYELGKYDQSILQFNDQTMRFPRGRFASAALLREAEAFMKINDRIDARLTLQKLLGDHPDAPEAPMARSMMQTLTS